MFYFKRTIDQKIRNLESAIYDLRKENSQLKSTLEEHGISTNYFASEDSRVRVDHLNKDFKNLLKHLNLRITIIEPKRGIVKLDDS